MTENKGINFISGIGQLIQSLLAHVTFTFCGADGSIHIDIIPVMQDDKPSLPEGETIPKLSEEAATPKLPEKADEVDENKSGVEVTEKKFGNVPDINGVGGGNEHGSAA